MFRESIDLPVVGVRGSVDYFICAYRSATILKTSCGSPSRKKSNHTYIFVDIYEAVRSRVQFGTALRNSNCKNKSNAV